MTIPYRSQYRNPLRRHLAIGLGRTVRLLSRPLVQLGVAVLFMLATTLWLHQQTPEQGGGSVDLRASGGYVQSYKAS